MNQKKVPRIVFPFKKIGWRFKTAEKNGKDEISLHEILKFLLQITPIVCK